jgi:hypothetical protein
MEICQNASALQCIIYKDRLLPAFFFILIFLINMIYSLVPEGEKTQSYPNQNKNNIATHFSW